MLRYITYTLSFSFVRPLVLMVDPAEVGDNDRDGKGDDEHSAEGADAADDLAGDGLRHHVAVPADAENHTLTQRSLFARTADG